MRGVAYRGLGALCALMVCALISIEVRAQGVLSGIDVQGNQRIEAETVRSYMPLRPGDALTPAAIDRALKSLFGTGLFADVSIQRSGDRLVVTVAENPIVNRIAFEGNDKLNDEALEAEVQLRPRVIFTRARAQADVQRLLELYRRSGRFAALVDPKVIELDQNRVDVVFEITEGPVTGIRRINFIGNEVFSDARLRDAIATEESRWWRFLSSNDTYDPDRLAFDREQLRRYYLARGYADFTVISAVAELTSDREDFFITFTVDEGLQYTFGEVGITTTLDELDPEELRGLIDFNTGDTYNADEVDRAVDRLTFAAGEAGYAFVDVRPRPRRNPDAQTIDMVFEINEGPRVYVERIEIEGNERTLDRVIRREFQLAEGDAFNRAKIDQSRRRLRALRFFRDVEITEEQGSAPDKSVVRVAVEEQSTGELSFGAGFSSVDSFIGDIALTERNFLGKGQFLRFAFTLSSIRQEFDFSFVEPYFFERDLSFGVDLFRRSTDFQDESSFDETETGAGLNLGFPVSEYARFSPRYRISFDEITDVPSDASPVIQATQGDFLSSTLGYSLNYDRRNDPIEPTQGFKLGLSQDVAGLGGDVRFVRNTVNGSVFQELFTNFVLRVSGEAGALFGFGGYDPNVLDRFIVSAGSLRGFDRAGIGPRDLATDDALGGNYFWTAQTELEFPLPGLQELGFSGSVFVDAGSLWDHDEDESVTAQGIGDEASVRVSAGVGLFWRSPLGPIRLDFAQALVKEDFDETQVFRFSAGTRF